MIRTMLLKEDGSYLKGDAGQLQQWRDDDTSVIWLDIECEPSETARELLLSMECNPLAINDAFRDRHPPKIEAFDNTTFLVFRGVSTIDPTLDITHQQVGVWTGKRFLITYHKNVLLGISHMWDGAEQHGLLRQPGLLTLKLLHYVGGLYLETLLNFEERLEDLEDGLLTEHSEEDMKELVGFRSRLRKLRRVFSYHKELSEQLLEFPEVYFPHLDDAQSHVRRDVYDRCERQFSLCQMYYELCADLVEGYISLSSHNLNQTMKVLTIISAVFVPLTFIAGIYGMNFQNMPELGWQYAYFGVMGFMATLALALLILFRRIRWL